MNIANRLTIIRIILAPLFFIVFFLDTWVGCNPLVSITGSWLIFAMIELSDFLDGFLARRLAISSDIGRVLDPFADSVSRLTYFISFTGIGLMPLWVLLIVVYRDLSIAFIRLLANRWGMTMGARLTGKIKAWIYAVAGVIGLLRISISIVLPNLDKYGILETGSRIVFISCAVIAVISLGDYVRYLYKKKMLFDA